MILLILAIAIAPGIAISLFVYFLHEFGRESVRQLLFSFVLGMLATVPPLLIQLTAGDVREDPSRHSVLGFAWYAFIIVALSEEGSKYLLLRYYAYPQSGFRGPFDGILFSVMIGMGFATVENIEYVWQFGLETGVSRFFLSVPAHASFAVLMGYQVGWAKREPERRRWWMAKGLSIAVLFHGSFDFFLFLQQKRAALPYAGMLSFGSFASFYIAVRLALRAIRMHSQEEQEQEATDELDEPGETAAKNGTADGELPQKF